MSAPNYAPPPSAFKGTTQVRGGPQPQGPKPEEKLEPIPPCVECTCGTVFNLDSEHATNASYVMLLIEVHHTRTGEHLAKFRGA